MTLDEAIKHCKDVARDNRAKAEEEWRAFSIYPFGNVEESATFVDRCDECAEQHEQLAQWLEELKELREIKEEYQKGMDNSYATFMYNKAIDDFVENIKECSGWTPNCIESWHDVCLTIYTLYQIAEELKKGGEECVD